MVADVGGKESISQDALRICNELPYGATRTRARSSEREIDSDTGEVRMVERTMDCLLHSRLTNYLGRGHQFIRTGRQESNARSGAHSVCHGATSSW